MRIWLSIVAGALFGASVLVAFIIGGPGTATGASVAGTQGVSMVNFSFSPDPITIPVGTTVQWTNTTTNTPHTTTSDTGVWDSGTVNPGSTFKFTFNSPGTFKYHCTFHQSIGMVGTITVGATPTPTRTPTPTPTETGPRPTLTVEAYLPDVRDMSNAATPTSGPSS